MHAAARQQRDPFFAGEPPDALRQVTRVGILGREQDERAVELLVQRGQEERERGLRHAGTRRERLGEGAQALGFAELGEERMQDRQVHSERPNRPVRPCHGTARMDALLGAVWLYATDVPRAVAFYRDVLELPVVDEAYGVGHFDAGNVRLSIHPARAGQPIGSGGFYVFIVEDIESEVARLSAAGVEFVGGITEEVFGRIAEFRDPDGHELSLWQIPREGEAGYDHIEPLARHYAQLRAALGR